jgi:phthiodiolone/phenolphthiodiolone dimycocerosates ketoreductase
VGVSVTDAGRRNPAVTAQAAATLHLLTGGRAILGIGTGEREGNEPYGVEWSKPVTRLEEALATIRALWNSGGELISRDSPYFPLHDAVFDLPPYKGKWPEIWVASHGPRMLRITSRYADAWVPALIPPPITPPDWMQCEAPPPTPAAIPCRSRAPGRDSLSSAAPATTSTRR